MSDELLADLLAMLGVINKHDGMLCTYSIKPHGKMAFIAGEIILLPTVVDEVEQLCLTKGFPLRISYRDNKYIVIVEKSWITVENEDLNRAKIEACVTTLEGTLK